MYCIENTMGNYIVPINGNTEINELFKKEQDKIYSYIPPADINRRILAQQSIFLISITGYIEKYKHHTINILSINKKHILDELEIFGISQHRLFQDFQGFVDWFNFNTRDSFYGLFNDAEEKIDNGEYSQAQILLQDAIAKKDENVKDVEIASVYHSLGYVYDEQGEYTKALEYYNKALEVNENILGANHPNTTTTLNNIAQIYTVLGNYDKALVIFKKLIKIEKSTIGENHYEFAVNYNNIGLVYFHKGDYDRALEYYFEALRIYKKHLRNSHHNIVTTLLNISTSYHYKGLLDEKFFDESLKYADEAINLSDREYPDIIWLYNNKATVFYKRKDYKNAILNCNLGLSICKKTLNSQHHYYADIHYTFGLIYSDQNKIPESVQSLTKAYTIAESVLGIKHELTLRIKEDLKDNYNKLGNPLSFDDWLEDKIEYNET